MRQILRAAWTRWKEMAVYVGDFQARVLLTLFYLFIAAPFGAIARILDPLGLRSRSRQSFWLPRKTSDNLSAARRQY